MEYVVKEIKEEIDIMYLTIEEYNQVNTLFFDIMKNTILILLKGELLKMLKPVYYRRIK